MTIPESSKAEQSNSGDDTLVHESRELATRQGSEVGDRPAENSPDHRVDQTSGAPSSSPPATEEAVSLWYVKHLLAWSTATQLGAHFVCMQGKFWRELEAKTVEDAAAIAREYRADPSVTGIYITQALMEGKRKAANARLFKSIWLDLDAKDFSEPGDDARTSGQRILRELSRFEAAIKMPRSCLVWSGGGVHCYWAFAHPIGFDQWAALAERLKEAALYCHLQADLQCTTDAARVLRVPGTVNRKPEYGVGRQTSILFPRLPAE